MIDIKNLNPATIQGKKLKIGMIKQILNRNIDEEEKYNLNEELCNLTNEISNQPSFLNHRLDWIHN